MGNDLMYHMAGLGFKIDDRVGSMGEPPSTFVWQVCQGATSTGGVGSVGAVLSSGLFSINGK